MKLGNIQIVRRFFVRLIPLFLLIILIFVLFRNFFSHGFLVYPDFFEIFQANKSLTGVYSYFSSWSFGFMGSSNVTSLPDYIILSLLSYIGIYGVLSEIFFIFLFLFIGFLGFFAILRKITSNTWILAFCLILYIITPALFIEIFNGSANFIFYSTLPALVYLSIELIVYLRLKYILYLSMLIGFQIFSNPFTLIFSILVLIFLLPVSIIKSPNLKSILISIISITTVISLSIILNFPYFLSYFSSISTVSSTFSVVSSSQSSFMMFTYQWANPLSTLTLLPASLFPRYSSFYNGIPHYLLFILPIAAFFGFLFPSTGEYHRVLKIGASMMVLFSYLLIILGHYGLLELLFNKIPPLYVFNYPEIFELIINLGYDILISLLIVSLYKSHYKSYFKSRRITTEKYRREILILVEQKVIPIVVPILIIILLLIASSANLESGNFNLLSISHDEDFPPQWPSTAPSSFYDIYNYLQTHNALLNERPLILPYPGFNGGQEFRGFDPFLFDQQFSVNPNSTNLEDLGSSPSAYYSTTVANDLINNCTNLIGIPLGYASVKYIIIDKQFNFSGPPRWDYGSLVGSPSSFMKILESQSDLRLVYNNSVISVFLNENFKPYIQQYAGSSLIAYSQQRNNESILIPTSIRPQSIGNWKIGSAYGNVSYTKVNNSYIIDDKRYGYYNLTFENTTPSGQLKLVEHGGNIPLYISSTLINSSELCYTLSASFNELNDNINNTYLSVFGFSSNNSISWIRSSYLNEGIKSQTLTIKFNPFLINTSTKFISINIYLPISKDGETSSFTLSNLSLYEKFSTRPNKILLPEVINDITNHSSLNQTFPFITNMSNIYKTLKKLTNICSITTINLNQSLHLEENVKLNNVYIMADYLSRTNYLSNQLERIPSGIGVYSVSINNQSLKFNNLGGFSYFNELGLYAYGDGKIMIKLECDNVSTYIKLKIDNSHFELINKSLPLRDYKVEEINVTGDIILNALVFSNYNVSTNKMHSESSNIATNCSYSFSHFQFLLESKTHFIFLSQSYNALWSLDINNKKFNSSCNLLFGNIFIINESHEKTIALIQFPGKESRFIGISIEFTAWMILFLFYLRKKFSFFHLSK